MNQKLISVIIIAIVIVGGVTIGMSVMPTSAHTQTYYVQLTDPPSVPIGTSSLNLSYDGIGLHIEGQGWVNVSAIGIVDLMKLQNVSELIATAKVPANSVINQLRFYINSAKIAVNGTEYNVTLANSRLEVPVLGAEKASTSAILDLSPTVIETFSGSTPIFFLVPSATAVSTQGGIQGGAKVGSIFGINGKVHDELASEHANVSIISSSVSVSGNVTTVTVTVKNNGNTSAEIQGISLDGIYALYASPIKISDSNLNATFLIENATIRLNVPFIVNGTSLVPLYTFIPPMMPNGIVPRGMGSYSIKSASNFEHGFNDRNVSGMMANVSSFVDNSNPFFKGNANNENGQQSNVPGNLSVFIRAPKISGYTIQPGQTVTFTYKGTIQFIKPTHIIVPVSHMRATANHFSAYLVPIKGNSYQIRAFFVPFANTSTYTTAN